MARPCTVELSVAETRDLSPRQGSSREPANGIDSLLGRRSRRSVLPPLPERPSLLGRSSSPRHHHHHSSSSSSSTNARGRTTTTYVPVDRPTPSNHRRRAASPSYWPTHRLDSDLDIPDEWGDDTVFGHLGDVADAANSNHGDENTEATEITDSDDQYLSNLADNEFSSPSSYPSFTNLPTTRGSQLADTATAAQASTPSLAATAPLRRSSACNGINFAPPSRSTTQLTASTTGESQNSSLLSNDASFDDFLSESPQSSFSESMPSTRARTGLVAANAAATSSRTTVLSTKNREPSRTEIAARHPIRPMTFPNQPLRHAVDLDDDPFSDERVKSDPYTKPKAEDLTTIDLTESNEVPEELLKKDVDNRIKISAFQCVICMDDVTNLTVTHCGHLYCAQCLHTSLHVETTMGKCPMCRSKIDMKPRPGYTTKTKGFWPLELKLMTTTRKGKRKADKMS